MNANKQNTSNSKQITVTDNVSVADYIWLVAIILPVIPKVIEQARYLLRDIMGHKYRLSVKVGNVNFTLEQPVAERIIADKYGE